MTTETAARIALVGARPFVSAAVNAGSGRVAVEVLRLIDLALDVYRDEKPPTEDVKPSQWQPAGGWPTDPTDPE